jgi:ABC-type nitrate/sulfonate/bicarbonate transport system ATPase subunit
LHLAVCERIAPGSSFVCIVGPSDCGKSTLLNIVAGFLKATSDEILVEGLPVRHPDPRRIFVFQENGVFPWLNVRENVGFGLRKQTQGERDRIIARYDNQFGFIPLTRQQCGFQSPARELPWTMCNPTRRAIKTVR